MPARPLVRLLGLAALVAAAPPPPPALAPYFRADRFDPGDYRWFRGAFAGANVAEKASYQALLDWRQRCRASDLAETRIELARLGVRPGATLDSMPYRTLACGQVATLPEPVDLHDWAGFVRDVALVRPLAQAYLASVAAAEEAAALDAPVLRDALPARTIGEQALRAGLDWALGSPDDAVAPTLTAQQRGLLVASIAIAMATRDHANTAWLKGIVARQGWPGRRRVGDLAADKAWLLVQHADAEPAFQLRALRLIEPLVVSGDVNRRRYAYLYDRVMLKLVGHQRYATQFTCRRGHLVPLPLENERAVDVQRRAMGLGTLAEHEAKTIRPLEPCQDLPTD